MPVLVEVADSSLMAKALGGRAPDLIDLAKKAEGDPELLLGALDALGSVSPRTRVAASKLLCVLSERSPEVLYAQFEVLTRVLRQETGILKRNAMLALANLAAVDHEAKLDAILDEYLAPISGPNLVEAACALRGAAVIARAKPQLTDRIAKSIVAVEKAEYASRDSHNVAIGKAIGALADFLPFLHDGHGVRLFVRRQVNNPRRVTRNRARRLLKMWAANNGHCGPD
jgi:hypothetical protein